MTTAERLARQMCDTRSRTLQEERNALVKQVPDKIYHRDLPKRVQEALYALKRAHTLIAQLEKTVTAAGLSGYEARQGKVRTAYSNNRRGTQQQVITDRYVGKEERIRQLRASVSTELLGLTPVEAKKVLTKLQQDLAKI